MSLDYPECFYTAEDCPRPCLREEWAWCPLNPEVERAPAPESRLSPEIEERIREAKWVREDMRTRSDPHLREITENLRRAHATGGGLICPGCGDTDHGNRMGKKPWCMKCNLPLMSAEKAAKWVKPQPPKSFPRGTGEPDGVMRWRDNK